MENFIDDIVFIMIILFTHVFVINIQTISNKQYFYGVYTKYIEIDSNIRKQIDKSFKQSLNLSLLFVITLFFIFDFTLNINSGINILIFTVVYLLFSLIYLKKAYCKVRNLKNKYLLNYNLSEIDGKNYKDKIIKNEVFVDRELLNLKVKLQRKFKVLFAICIGLSILSFLYVVLNYNNLPDTIITHWNGKGNPDGFSNKNIISVFSMNFIDLSLVILLAVIGVETVGSKTYIDINNLEQNRKKAIKYLNGIGYSFLLLTLSMQSITTTIPIFMVNQRNIPIWITLIVCILPIFLTVPLIYFYIMLGSLKPKDKTNYFVETDDEKWIYGFIYYNKEDPSVMVEKRLGIGWSINMASPKGKFITFIIFIMTFGSLALVFI